MNKYKDNEIQRHAKIIQIKNINLWLRKKWHENLENDKYIFLGIMYNFFIYF